MPRKVDDDAFSRLKSQSYYDCVNINDLQYSMRLFGNANVGSLNLTNLQVAGMIAYGDRSFIVQRWYARTNLPESGPISEEFRIWANSVAITFIIGHHPTWTLSLYELCDRRPRTAEEPEARRSRLSDGDPWPVLVPTRQNISVNFDSFQGPSHDRLRALLRQDGRFERDTTPWVWIHIEGVMIPEGVNAKEIFARVTALEQKRRTVEEEIARWLTGMANDPNATEDTKATMSVISDGILEGRHKR